jgi:hypothetical protein
MDRLERLQCQLVHRKILSFNPYITPNKSNGLAMVRSRRHHLGADPSPSARFGLWPPFQRASQPH